MEIKEFIGKLIQVTKICGWQAAFAEIEQTDGNEDSIQVASDIHGSAVEEYAVLSSFEEIVEKCKALFGDLLLSYDVMENAENDISPYRLTLEVSLDTHASRKEEETR